MSKPILCLDFDGVIHSYTSGWQGAEIVSDPPVPGACEFIIEAVEHFEVYIYSSRSHQDGGIRAMQNWLRYWMDQVMPWPESRQAFNSLQWPTQKPAARVTIDDRAITFTGVWPSIEDLKNFKPWNKS